VSDAARQWMDRMERMSIVIQHQVREQRGIGVASNPHHMHLAECFGIHTPFSWESERIATDTEV